MYTVHQCLIILRMLIECVTITSAFGIIDPAVAVHKSLQKYAEIPLSAPT